MPVEWGERKPVGTIRYVKAATCDRCGKNAYRPGEEVASVAQALKRPDENGNMPEVAWEVVLCHDCADELKAWVDAGAGA